MNFNVCGRKLPWPDLSNCVCICSEGLSKITNKSIRIANHSITDRGIIFSKYSSSSALHMCVNDVRFLMSAEESVQAAIKTHSTAEGDSSLLTG